MKNMRMPLEAGVLMEVSKNKGRLALRAALL